MLGDISGLEKIYTVYGYTDMRKSIDELCAIIEDQFKMDPSSSALFLFCGRRRDRIKVLFRESDGFVLIYKRLAIHGGYQWPRKQSRSGIFLGGSLTG
nr:IS66 family insertion sequence element accessory protein TnpB [[Clostridium] scindens]